MPHSYHLTIRRLSAAASDNGAREIAFDVINHDEIIGLVDRLKASQILPDEDSAAFMVGLKLFGEVLLHNRNNSLCAEFFPQFVWFMKRLKAAVQKAADA